MGPNSRLTHVPELGAAPNPTLEETPIKESEVSNSTLKRLQKIGGGGGWGVGGFESDFAENQIKGGRWPALDANALGGDRRGDSNPTLTVGPIKERANPRTRGYRTSRC